MCANPCPSEDPLTTVKFFIQVDMQRSPYYKQEFCSGKQEIPIQHLKHRVNIHLPI
jgi:hypothetical protein